MIHSLAGVASLVNGLPIFYKLLIGLSIILSLLRYLRYFCYQFQPYTLSYTVDTGWGISLKNNDLSIIQPLATTVITTQFIVLHYRLQNGKKRNLFIMRDSLSANDYQALLLLLKMSGLSKQQQVH